MNKTLVAAMALITMQTLCGFRRTESVAGVKMENDSRNVPLFDGVVVCCGIEVILKEGTQAVIIKAEENVLPFVVTEVENGILNISYKNKLSLKTCKKVTVYVTAPAFKMLEATSGSSIESDGVLDTKNINIRASSGADISVSINSDKVICKASSGSNIVVKGKAVQIDGEASSSGDIDAQHTLVQQASAYASSGSNILLNVGESLEASASSGGDIRYTGSVTKISKKSTSGGSVKRIAL